MFKNIILLLSAVFCLTQAQRFSGGPCPNTAAKSSMDWSRFSGKWYEITKIPNFYELTGKCITNTYSGALPNIKMSLTQANMTTGVFFTNNATLTMPSATDGSFKALFDNAPFGIQLNAKVIETDYSNYAVLHACMDFLFFNLQYAWVKSRTRFLLSPNYDTALTAYDRLGLDRSLLIPTDQFTCPLLY